MQRVSSNTALSLPNSTPGENSWWFSCRQKSRFATQIGLEAILADLKCPAPHGAHSPRRSRLYSVPGGQASATTSARVGAVDGEVLVLVLDEVEVEVPVAVDAVDEVEVEVDVDVEAELEVEVEVEVVVELEVAVVAVVAEVVEVVVEVVVEEDVDEHVCTYGATTTSGLSAADWIGAVRSTSPLPTTFE